MMRRIFFFHICQIFIHLRLLLVFIQSRLAVWFFVTRLLTGLERTVSEAWRIAASFCIATARIRGFRDSIEAFCVVYIGRAVYPVLRAGWLNVCRTHGPAILSSSLIVPTAALNHIYLSENQAAPTVEAVHLSRRVPPFDAQRVEYGTRKRGIIVRSANRIPRLHSSRPSSRGCLFARANRKIA